MKYDICLVELPMAALESPKMYFGLGNLYLAAVLLNKGVHVCIADFREKIGELPDAYFYAFSCATPQIKIAKELAKSVVGRTIIGGAHATLLPDDCEGHFDYVVVGEGEEVITEILQDDWDNGKILAGRLTNINEIPYPAWDIAQDVFSDNLFEGERYGHGRKSMTITTSRGCPFNCSFCGNLLRDPVVFRSIDNIIGEVKALIDRGVTHFRFIDDNFTLHPHFNALCRELSRLDIQYRCHTRSRLLTPIRAQGLAMSGCEECSVGVESADDRLLIINKKKESARDHARALEILKHEGILSKVYLMSGLPGENDDSIRMTKQFMKANSPDKWTLSTFTPYPGCDIFNHPENYGVEIINRNYENWWNFVFNVRGLELPYRAGYVHKLHGQTVEEMKARHDDLYDWLLKYDKEKQGGSK